MNQKHPYSLSSKDLDSWLHKDTSQPVLVDVREEHEIVSFPFPLPVIHLPLSQAATWSIDLKLNLSKEKPIVVICHAGIRSWDFGTWLLEQDLGYEVWNLQGGMEAWTHLFPKYSKVIENL